jgi:hypothetical protein
VKEEYYLVHACVEGPEAGVYYRGKATMESKKVVVTLPDYVDKLADNFTVSVTPILEEEEDEVSFVQVRTTEVKNNAFTIYSDKPCTVHWMVFGTRLNIKVEVPKSEVTRRGDGPYTWI